MSDRPTTLDHQVTLYPKGTPVENSYELESGICVLPIAQDPPQILNADSPWSPVVILKLHAPYRKRILRYDVEKQNNPPIMPSPSDSGDFKFLRGSIYFSTTGNTTYCNYDWKVVAEYTYIENCVSRPEDGFVLGCPQIIMKTDVENLNQIGGVPVITSPGAIKNAGWPAKIGYFWGNLINTEQPWGYNFPAFYPGTLFNNGLVNSSYTSEQFIRN